ncbi:hypothetical protein HYFRA_00013145 [Hymenoscyphus fraxineus]|uniref:RING-type domain-containing protein n=1 Tax=Hymenoscyphus fraxineus TaxID=746836 RepID=A0A9N9PYE0_9HELO|nr:hypothetical protein HYFRA_00013145 [Hymenoscyphus fraxineus]
MPSKRDIVKNNPMKGLRAFLPRLEKFRNIHPYNTSGDTEFLFQSHRREVRQLVCGLLIVLQKEAVAGLLRPFSNNGTLAAALRLSNDRLQARTVNLEHARPLLERVLTYKATTKGYSLELKIWNDAIGLVNKINQEYSQNHPNENQEPLFPRFGSLPPELRMMVWGYAALDSCLIATTRRYIQHPFPWFPWLPPRSTYRLFACNIPALFLVNRESRAEALKTNPGFVLNGSFGIDGMLRVAPTQAIIHLKPSFIRRYTDDDGMVKDFADSLSGSEKAKIKNIAIDLDADHQGTVVGELMGFPMLENVVVVLMHKGLRSRGFRSKDELVGEMEHKVTQTFGLIKAWDTTWNVPSFQVLYLGNEYLDGSYDPDESSKFLSNYWSSRKGCIKSNLQKMTMLFIEVNENTFIAILNNDKRQPRAIDNRQTTMCRTYGIIYHDCRHVDIRVGWHCMAEEDCTKELVSGTQRFGKCLDCIQDEFLILRDGHGRMDGMFKDQDRANFFFKNVTEYLFNPVLTLRQSGIDAFEDSINGRRPEQALLFIYYLLESEYQKRCHDRQEFDRAKMRHFLAQLMWLANQTFVNLHENKRQDRDECLEKVTYLDLETLELPDDHKDRRCLICQENFIPYQLGLETNEGHENGQESSNQERPLKITCGHVFGERCLKRWINEREDWTTATCPVCRRKFPTYMEMKHSRRYPDEKPLWLQALFRQGEQVEYLENRRKYHIFIQDATLTLPLSKGWKRNATEFGRLLIRNSKEQETA